MLGSRRRNVCGGAAKKPREQRKRNVEPTVKVVYGMGEVARLRRIHVIGHP